MGRLPFLALITILLAAGCASTPEQSSSSLTAPGVAAASEVDGEVQLDPSVEVVSADELETLTEEELADVQIVCRQMLQPASNTIVQRCMTRESWRTYERAQEEYARRFLRSIRGEL